MPRWRVIRAGHELGGHEEKGKQPSAKSQGAFDHSHVHAYASGNAETVAPGWGGEKGRLGQGGVRAHRSGESLRGTHQRADAEPAGLSGGRGPALKGLMKRNDDPTDFARGVASGEVGCVVGTAFIGYIVMGILVGLLGGMLGIGGGSLIVPGLVFLLRRQGIPLDLAMKIAVATSLASILFTSLRALHAQQRRQAIDWHIASLLGVAAVMGSLVSGYAAAYLSGAVLTVIFGIFLGIVGLQLLAAWRPVSHWALPGRPALFAVGIGIGALSALLGIGGGSLTVPFLTACQVDMRRAIAISTTLGVPIALFGALGFVSSGLQRSGLPPETWGYIYLPAFLGLTPVAVLVAPLGVYWAHRLPVGKLRRVFGVLLLATSSQMILMR